MKRYTFGEKCKSPPEREWSVIKSMKKKKSNNISSSTELLEHLKKEALAKFLCDTNIKDELLAFTKYDLSKTEVYGEGYVIVTKNDILIVEAMEPEQRTYLFGESKEEELQKEIEAYKHITFQLVERIERKKVSKLGIESCVNGGYLTAEMKDGMKQLVLFTNSCMNKMKQFSKKYEKLQAGETEEETAGEENKKKSEEFCPKCGSRYPNRERKICPKCMDKRSIMRRLLGYFAPYKVRIAVMLLCYLIMASLSLVWPYLNGVVLYDKVLSKNDEFLTLLHIPAGKYAMSLLVVVLTMAFAKLFNQILGIIQGVMVSSIVPDVVKEIRKQIFTSLGRLSVGFFNRKQTGGLMTRVLSDAQEVTGFFIDGLPYVFTNVLTVIFLCIAMFRIHLPLSICCLMLIPFVVAMSVRMLPRLWSYYGRRYRVTSSMNSQVNDNVTGARVVKAFGQEQSERNRFEAYNGRVKQAELSLVAYDNRFKALYNVTINAIIYIVWGVGSVVVLGMLGKPMEFGMLVTFIGYVTQLKDPLDFMSNFFHWWTDCMNCAQRIFEVIDAVPEIQESAHPVAITKKKGEIKFDHVTFGYEQHKPVLKDISFVAPAGQMLGIVGHSGAGKSTLVNLISRLYDVQEGCVTIDGVDVRDISFEELHSMVAMVSQETYIFMGTVAENIAYARPDASRSEIIQAAILASAHDFICKMPDSYDTMIGTSGRELSGGERQRISIARAILANPKILILDEATASVDTETERAIQASIDYLVQGRTTLSIAHRLSTLKNAKNLIVIEDGKLTEEGTHKELIAKEGTYFKLMELQTKALALRGIE